MTAVFADDTAILTSSKDRLTATEQKKNVIRIMRIQVNENMTV